MSDMGDEKPKAISPAPWKWGAGKGKWVLVDANDKPMLSFSEWSIEPGDMPLISRAPDLLAMLREVQPFIVELHRGHDCEEGEYCGLRKVCDRLAALLSELT